MNLKVETITLSINLTLLSAALKYHIESHISWAIIIVFTKFNGWKESMLQLRSINHFSIFEYLEILVLRNLMYSTHLKPI